MGRITLLVVAAVTMLGALAPVAGVAATRAFVSGKGTDSSTCGPVATPCRTPQYAHDVILTAGGEIDILDPAGYGSMTITKAISIINDSAGIAGFLALAGGTAITIDANGSDVVLRGLTVEGSNVADTGILYRGGRSLTISNCTIAGFTNEGITIAPHRIGYSNPIAILDTVVSNNSIGIGYLASSGESNSDVDGVNVILSRVVTNNNGYGFHFTNSLNSINVSIANHVASNNIVGGTFYGANGGSTFASIQSSMFSTNAAEALEITGDSETMRTFLSHTTLFGNGTGVDIHPLNSVPTVYSFSDNRINENGTDINGGLLTPIGQQ